MGKRQQPWRGGGGYSSYQYTQYQPAAWQLWRESWSPRGRRPADSHYDAYSAEDWPHPAERPSEKQTADTENSAKLRAVQQALTKAKKADQRIRKIAEEETKRAELWKRACMPENNAQAAAMVKNIVLMQTAPPAESNAVTMSDPYWDRMMQEVETASLGDGFLQQAMQFAAMSAAYTSQVGASGAPAAVFPTGLPAAPNVMNVSTFAAPPGLAPAGGCPGGTNERWSDRARCFLGPFVGSPLPAAPNLAPSPMRTKTRPSPGQARQPVKTRTPPPPWCYLRAENSGQEGDGYYADSSGQRARYGVYRVATMPFAPEAGATPGFASTATVPLDPSTGVGPQFGGVVPSEAADVSGAPCSIFAAGPVPVSGFVHLEDDDDTDQ
ncbi:unnamed protein product, partial [Symbiodinium microadriaticum]